MNEIDTNDFCAQYLWNECDFWPRFVIHNIPKTTADFLFEDTSGQAMNHINWHTFLQLHNARYEKLY